MRQSHDVKGVQKFKGAYYGGKALLVLGGNSAENWESVRDDINPDVILGANGTCFNIDNLDFHMVTENMHMASGKAVQGDKRYQEIMGIITNKHNAKVRLISYLSWDLLDYRTKEKSICIKRIGELGDDYESQMQDFSFREYKHGYLAGPLFDHPGTLTSKRIKFRVGTVATQLLHHAGVLGVSEVHTVGMDFCFKDQNKHHNYNYPTYQPDRFRTAKMFTKYKDVSTMWDWVQGGLWMKEVVEPLMERDGLKWVDHSNGLLKVMGLRCANGR